MIKSTQTTMNVTQERWDEIMENEMETYWPKGANGENLEVPAKDVVLKCGCIRTHSNDGCGMFKSEITHTCLKHRTIPSVK